MLNENIRALRQAKKLSQEELACELHVVRQTVSKWEKGLSVPDAEMVNRLADALGTTVPALLGETLHPEETQETLQSLSEQLAELNRLYARQQERRRRIWRVVCGVVAVLSGLILASALAAFLSTMQELSATQAIGGADGPTRILVVGYTPQWLSLLLVFAAGAAAVVGLIHTRRR